jgi:PiT family inorganic phosphate transporter
MGGPIRGSTDNGLNAIKWGIAGRVIWAWVLTIPASAAIAAVTLALTNLLGWS